MAFGPEYSGKSHTKSMPMDALAPCITSRVLASPKFLPTDSDLCSSQIRPTALAKKGLLNTILHVNDKNANEII